VLAALFYLLSLYLYIKWRNHKQGGLLFYVLSIIAAIAASKTKEISFTLPFVILLTEYVFFTEPGKWISRKRLFALIPYAIVLIIIPLSILGPELGLWSDKTVLDDGFTRVQQLIDIKELSSYSYLMTQFTVVPKYIQLFFLPISQNLDYDYPLYHSFFNLKVAAGFFLLLIIFVSAILAASFAKKSRRPLFLLASAGVLWFFITLSIESTVVPIRDVIFEHRMYLPGAGLALGVAVLIVHILRGRQRAFSGKAILVAALIIITPLTALALKRAMVWSDIISLYEDIALKSPEKARARNNLGVLYASTGQRDKAIIEFRKTLALNPDYAGPHKNLARVLFGKGNIRGAINEFKAALSTNPADYEIHEALAGIYRDEGLFEKSEKEYKIVLALVPSNVNSRNNLANIYISEKRYNEAILEFKKILLTHPQQVEVYLNLAIALEKAGESDEAIYYYRKFVELAPAGLGDVREKVRRYIKQISPEQR